jgi:uncharacterized protein YaeQ
MAGCGGLAVVYNFAMPRLNVDISINDYERELFVERRTVLELRDGESMAHIALKMLGMILFHTPDLLVEPTMDADDRYKPDLLIRSDDFRPRLWVECGQCRVQKLDKITFRYYDAKVVMLKRTAREAREIMERCRGQVRRLEAIEFIGFDAGFVDCIGNALTGRNDVIAILSGARIQVLVGHHNCESAIHRFRG